MLRLSLAALVLIAVAAILTPTLAEWGGGRCGPVGPLVLAQPPLAPVTPPRPWRWHIYPENPAQAFLLDARGNTLGGWDFAQRHYRPFVDGVWGQVAAPPLTPPAAGPANVTQNFGVALDKLAPCTQPCYWHRGMPITKEQAWSAVAAGGQLPDDRDKPWLVVIGKESDRKRYLEAYQTHVEPELRAKLRVKSLAPDDWSLHDPTTGQALFVTTGTPTVYCQAPDGEVLSRQDDYQGPGDFGAIRKALGYDPKKDRDLRHDPDLAAGIPLLVWIGLGAVVFLMLRGGSGDAGQAT